MHLIQEHLNKNIQLMLTNRKEELDNNTKISNRGV